MSKILTTSSFLNSKNVKELYEEIPFPAPWITKQDYELAISSPLEKKKIKTRVLKNLDKKLPKFKKRFGFDFEIYGDGDGYSFLDAGCGTGNKTLCLSRIYPKAKITALDITSKSLDYFRYALEILDIENVDLINTDFSNEKFKLENKFDHIFSLGVLHHLPKPEIGFKNLINHLKPKGLCSFFFYNHWGRSTNILFNKLVILLSKNKSEIKHKIIEAFNVNPKKKGWFDTSTAELLFEKKTLSIKDFLPPILKRFSGNIKRWLLKKMLVLKFDKPMITNDEIIKRYSWDQFAHPIVHEFDVKSLSEMVGREDFELKEVRFTNYYEIKPEEYIKKILTKVNLNDLTSNLDSMKKIEIFELAECLMKPRGFYCLVKKRVDD